MGFTIEKILLFLLLFFFFVTIVTLYSNHRVFGGSITFMTVSFVSAIIEFALGGILAYLYLQDWLMEPAWWKSSIGVIITIFVINCIHMAIDYIMIGGYKSQEPAKRNT